MSYTRRKFISHSLLASASLMVPEFLQALNSPSVSPLGNNDRKLVIVQLSGGNDGLNTIVPFRNDIYYSSRPVIGLRKEQLIGLTDDIALNKAVTPLKKLYDDGLLTIINNVGYPNPDYSHFRSMDIWQSASGSENLYNTGWVGRYLDATCNGSCTAHTAVELDGYLGLALKGERINGIATHDPEKLLRTLRDPFLESVMKNHPESTETDNLSYLYKVMRDTYSSTEYLADKARLYNTKQTYPDNAFANRLKTIAALIHSNASTKIYYISSAGFDTHVNQLNAQERSLSIVAEGLGAFTEDLKTGGRINDVTIMVFSEFGRRVAQNASGGTDHGTANNVWIISGVLKKRGVYNPIADLPQLTDGDLKHNIDFRSVYATLLSKWLEANDVEILKNKFEQLSFI